MRRSRESWQRRAIPAVVVLSVAFGVAAGCGGSSAFDFFFGTPFPSTGGAGGGPSGPGGSGTTPGGGLPGGGTGTLDPCDESQPRKFITITMANASPDYVHYFLILVAFVDGERYPDGAACPDDVQLYTSNGYILVPAGQRRELGHYCIEGPALYYYHRNGQFRGVSGSAATALASAIAPAQGTSLTYDQFFTSAGGRLPVPNLILFHNPGTGEGAALRVSRSMLSPCNPTGVQTFDPDCQQDGWYYVDETDRMVGSTALGFGSGRRVPDEIQGTGCNCGISNEPWAVLAPPNVTAGDAMASSALCNTFFRGGRITFIFVRDDRDPPYPQLLWQVTDSTGARAHDFDPRSQF